ncbi:MAG: hypothetical protein WCS87_16140 [Methylococcaceae bacterium]
MKSFRFYIALLLILFSVNSIAESGVSANDIHDQRVVRLHSMNKSLITVDCYYVPTVSQYESPPSAPTYAINDCDAYPYNGSFRDTCLKENEKAVNDVYQSWVISRILKKTIPVWSKCPESVEVGYNKYTHIWKILE